MRIRWIKIALPVFLIITLSAVRANALKIGFVNLAGGQQVDYFVDVTDAGGNKVLYTFTSEGPSNDLGISKVYFDDNSSLLDWGSIVIQESAGVSFAVDPLTPGLPGGQVIGFFPDLVVGTLGGKKNAIGPGESLGTLFDITGGDYSDVLTALGTGSLRIAVTGSQSAVNSGAPVPEPSTMLLLLSGLAGLGFFRRRKMAA